MCVIIHKPKQVVLRKALLKQAWDSNADGAGISFYLKDNIQVIKGLMTFEHFYEVYNEIKELELVIHFRWATHGAKVPEFTHPFKIQSEHCKKVIFNDASMILHHNGVLSKFGSKDLSDTVDYCNKILSKIKSVEAIKHVLNNESSKFVLHTKKMIHRIGHFQKHEKAYFSNLNFFTVYNSRAYDAWNNGYKETKTSTGTILKPATSCTSQVCKEESFINTGQSINEIPVEFDDPDFLVNHLLDEYMEEGNLMSYKTFSDFIESTQQIKLLPHVKDEVNETCDQYFIAR